MPQFFKKSTYKKFNSPKSSDEDEYNSKSKSPFEKNKFPKSIRQNKPISEPSSPQKFSESNQEKNIDKKSPPDVEVPQIMNGPLFPEKKTHKINTPRIEKEKIDDLIPKQVSYKKEISPREKSKYIVIRFTSAYRLYAFTKKITVNQKERFIFTLQKVLEERIPEDINVKIDHLILLSDNRCEVGLRGEKMDDVTFVASIFKELIGETVTFDHLQNFDIVRGYCQSVGDFGFGMFVDGGITEPDKHILVPLHVLREQLAKNEKISTREIIKKYGFMNSFPVNLEIISIIGGKDTDHRMEARFAESTLNQIRNWVDMGLDIVFAVGQPRQMIKRVLAKRGHSSDVIEIQRLGPLETALICKQGTFAPGIIAHIGNYLSQTRFSKFIPAQVKRFW